MPYYRVCFMQSGKAVCFDEFLADDDIQAKREAVKHVTSGEAILWCGERRVTSIGDREGQIAG